jgi:hypothetical protein
MGEVINFVDALTEIGLDVVIVDENGLRKYKPEAKPAKVTKKVTGLAAAAKKKKAGVDTDFEAKVEALIENIKKDYYRWSAACAEKSEYGWSDVAKKMVTRFNDGLKWEMGKKYVRITTESGSVWGFVVAVDDDKKFKKGDILKPAGWKTPTRNAARGNIVEGGYSINWTGPNYLI